MTARQTEPDESASLYDPLVLACAADDGYALPLSIMLYSALRNYSGANGVSIYILDGGITTGNRERIERALSPFSPNLHWIRPSMNLVSGLTLRKYLTVTAYLRLLIPELLPSIERVLYLDCDILIDCDLQELWIQEVGDAYFLAVSDGSMVAQSPVANLPAVAFGADDVYFNSGVLLMNLSQWRDENVSDKALVFCREAHQLDQDALNAVAVRRWVQLAPHWNMRVNAASFRFRRNAILHFTGRKKPWLANVTETHRATEQGAAHRLYDEYLRQAGWMTASEMTRYRAARLYQKFIKNALIKIWLIATGKRAKSHLPAAK